MVGAVRAGEDFAGQIIVTTELFYQRKTQLRFLRAIRTIIDAEIKRLEAQEKEEAKEK